MFIFASFFFPLELIDKSLTADTVSFLKARIHCGYEEWLLC